MKQIIRLLVMSLFAALYLTACGSGGGDSRSHRTVNAVSGRDGSIFPPSQIVPAGGSANFSLIPLLGFSPQVTGCGGTLSGNIYTTGPITADCTVSATFVNPQVTLVTSLGPIVMELYPGQAPVTAANFLQYVRDGFYTDTIFHRVIAGFVVQGGGFTADGTQKATRPAITLEAPSVTGLSNGEGMVAMARSGALNSATSQFYINTAANNPSAGGTNLDKPDGEGYAVFGKVIQGMEIVELIEAGATGSTPQLDWPVSPVLILSAAQTL